MKIEICDHWLKVVCNYYNIATTHVHESKNKLIFKKMTLLILAYGSRYIHTCYTWDYMYMYITLYYTHTSCTCDYMYITLYTIHIHVIHVHGTTCTCTLHYTIHIHVVHVTTCTCTWDYYCLLTHIVVFMLL